MPTSQGRLLSPEVRSGLMGPPAAHQPPQEETGTISGTRAQGAIEDKPQQHPTERVSITTCTVLSRLHAGPAHTQSNVRESLAAVGAALATASSGELLQQRRAV